MGVRSVSTAALRRPRLLGLLLAAVAFAQSLAPTLTARDWYFQGLVSGVAVAIAYGIGALLTWLGELALRAVDRRPTPLSEEQDVRLRVGLLLVLTVALAYLTRSAVRAHRWTWERLGHDPGDAWVALGGTILLTLVVFVLLLGLVRLYVWIRDRSIGLGRRWLPRWVAIGVGTVFATWLIATALSDWVYQRSLDALNEAFTLSDLEIEDAMDPPTSRLRSAGPASEVAWEEVGDEGRRFLSRGASTELLGEWTVDGAAAREPVRVFVGRATSSDPDAQSALALAELERFDAFERQAVLVVIPTGTGWVNEQIVQPVEYLHGGDVATVAVQYSHLPSPLAFLTEAEAARESARALVAAVQDRIEQSPPDERPQLLVAGESLGSFGGSAAFDSLDELVATTDASLWVGPPPTMHLRREAERNRRAGSLQIKPVVGDGTEILFASRASDVVGHPRSVFLQQADDAIVWWDWPTAYEEPDWLDEPLDPAVNPQMRWYPVTTFLNLAVDMALSTTFEEEQGHMYGTQPTLAWTAMLAPRGWDAEKVARLRAELSRVGR